MAARIQFKRGLASAWTTANPTLFIGECGFETDTGRLKVGDGTTAWNSLSYFFGDISGANLGDFGDVSGATPNTGDILRWDGSFWSPDNIVTSDISDITSTASELNILDGVTATTTELNYVDGVTSSIQTQLNAKSPIDNPTFTGTVTIPSGASISGYAPLNSPTFTGTVSGITKTMVGLGSVDNTSDADKPVSTAQQTALNLKANLASPTFTGTVTIPSGASISGYAPLNSPTFTGTVSVANLTLSGDLTINGTTTIINSTIITVDDKNIELGSVDSPTDITADGGGITLKGTTDKTINWVQSTAAWTSSEDFNLLTDKVYEINGTTVLSATTLGSGVTSSSLTSLGTIATGVWNGTLIGSTYGGTGVNNGSSTITIGGNFTTSGSFTTTLTVGADTNVTLPSTGTIATLTGTETFTNKTLTSPTVNTPVLTLATSASTTDARLSWDSTNKKIQVGDGTVALDFASSTVITNAQTASYTLVLADKDKLVEISNASANNLTIPLNSSVAFPVGTQITVLQTGAGTTTLVATGGVTLNATPGLILRARWSSVTLIKRATDTWVAIGDLRA